MGSAGKTVTYMTFGEAKAPDGETLSFLAAAS